MTSTIIRPAMHATAISGQLRIKAFWENLKSMIVSILERADHVAPVDELDKYEGERFERLIDSLRRAERIRRNAKI